MIHLFSEQFLYEEEKPKHLIESLYQSKKFLSADNPLLQEKHQQDILKSIKIEEFVVECQLNPLLSYNEAVVRACPKACMYVLFAIRHNSAFGKRNLKHIEVAQGFIGYTRHSWLILDNTYIIDLTLAQFTSIIIPKVAILHMDDAKELYKEASRHTWLQWTDMESEQIDIPI